MASRRRLSHSSECLGELIEDDVEDEEEVLMLKKVKSRNSVGRLSVGSNRSSMGFEQTAEEQQRIADMYKTVIKMSSENKINDKNSWSFDLIDHMGRLIRDEGRGVNFQKASCTLDASVKIYSHRVDDTHASGHRILESLSRNGNNSNDSDEPVEGEKRKYANRHISSETIERNLENINHGNMNETQSTDPMFHKMSKAFDEGGAKGMLMNNMRLKNSSCDLMFASNDGKVATDSNVAMQNFDSVDISDLIYKSGIMLSELSDLEICPAIDDYRDSIGVVTSEFGIVTPSIASMFSRDLHIASKHQQENNRSSSGEGQVASSSDYNPIGYDDDNDGDNYLDDEIFSDKPDAGGRRRLSMCAPEPQGNGCGPAVVSDDDDNDIDMGGFGFVEEEMPEPGNDKYTGKIHWDAVFEGDKQGDPSGRRQSIESKQVSLWQQVNIMNSLPADATDEYNFFNFDQLSQANNEWAGSRHWKFAKSKSSKKDSSADADKKATKGKKAKAAKTTKSLLDFTSPPPSDDLFATTEAGKKSSRAKADPTVFSDAILSKQMATANEQAYLLPHDAHFEALDMCRLSSVSNVLFPGTLSANQIKVLLIKKHSTQSDASSENIKRFNINSLQDKVWGEIVDFSSLIYTQRKNFAPGNASAASNQLNIIEDDSDDYNGDFGFGDDNDNDYEFPSQPQEHPTDDNPTLSIDSDGLLKAARVVEKVSVGYSTTATKVNVKKLKTDIWHKISDSIETDSLTAKDVENISPAKGNTANHPEDGKTKPEKLSFQQLISSVASEQRQGDVSLPYYFICLLHLANEKTLRIEDTDAMDDLWISNDAASVVQKMQMMSH